MSKPPTPVLGARVPLAQADQLRQVAAAAGGVCAAVKDQGPNRRINGHFRAGVSGNPAGRPKGSLTFPALVGERRTRQVAEKLLALALEGDPRALESVAVGCGPSSVQPSSRATRSGRSR